MFALALVISNPALAALPFPVKISAANISYQGVELKQVKLQTFGQDGLRLGVEQAGMAGQDGLAVQQLSLECAQLGNAAEGWCPAGAWQLQVQPNAGGWRQDMHGQLAEAVWNEQRQSVTSSLTAGEFEARVRYSGPDAAGQASGLSLDWGAQGLERLPFRALLPAQLDWIKSGTSRGSMRLGSSSSSDAADARAQQKPGAIHFQLQLEDISLDSPDGLYAAEGLNVRTQGQYTPGNTASLHLTARFLSGQVLLDRFYTEFGPQPLQLKTRLALAGGRVDIQDLQVDDGSSLQLGASAEFELDDPAASLQYQVRQLDMQFPLAYERYLEPVLASWTLDNLTVTGGLNWSGTGAGGEFPSGTLRFEDLSVVDHEQDRFAFTGMTANIQAGRSIGQSEFSWRGLLLGRINLGAGTVALNTAPGHFELAEPLRLAVLGGEFSVDEFSLDLPSATVDHQDPVVNFNAGLHALDMEQLTAALGWPGFQGRVSGRIPGASFDQGVLTVDGVLSFEAFDGRIELSNLRVERIFGVLPSFAADLEVDNLDLELVTSAFSFGSIAGRLDGYVHDLRMLDWSPVSFDAWMGTPERQADSRSISRQAVNNLTSIGGGGATAALTGPIMRMFSNFSYKRLGMGCRLENYVCSIRGLADEDNSVIIMEGSGIPKLSIRVFNRRMDWPQLVANLVAATSGGDIRIGDP